MTKLLYLDDTYQFEGSAALTDSQIESGMGTLFLDRTIFYPKGGGQPADLGTIRGQDFEFQVEDVSLDESGVVHHRGRVVSGESKTLLDLDLKVDSERRIAHAKLHSAGHLIDAAVQVFGLKDLVATKGYHFPDSPYVEYKGEVENPSELIAELNKICGELIASDVPIIAEALSPEEAKSRGIWAPPGKSARFVYFEGFEAAGCGCGGTHVSKSSEIGAIEIRKIKRKKGQTRISYQLR